MTDHVYDRDEYADDIASIVDMKDAVDGYGAELLTADVLILLNEHAKLKREIEELREWMGEDKLAEMSVAQEFRRSEGDALAETNQAG